MLRCCLVSTPRLRLPKFVRCIHKKTAKNRITLPYSEPILVFHSQNCDPFLNLAYENWMYENLDLEKHDILMFWQNSPSVVVGRHQNPWLECNVKELERHGVKLARRYSGGGTVYHDLGNLNITFLTKRARYNRRRNLESIVKALSEGWDLNVAISPRDDLLVDDMYKISGSAAKLGKYTSYHHCTLLCDTDLEMLQKIIAPSQFVTTSKSTQSVTSRVVNLKELESSLTLDEVKIGIAKAYGNSNQDPQLLPLKIFEPYSSEIDKIRTELQNWEWIYGKTAQFTLTRTVLSSSGAKIVIVLEIISGTIKNLTLTPNIVSVANETLLKGHLIGTRFIANDIYTALNKYMQSCADGLTKKYMKEILSCIIDMI